MKPVQDRAAFERAISTLVRQLLGVPTRSIVTLPPQTESIPIIGIEKMVIPNRAAFIPPPVSRRDAAVNHGDDARGHGAEEDAGGHCCPPVDQVVDRFGGVCISMAEQLRPPMGRSGGRYACLPQMGVNGRRVITT